VRADGLEVGEIGFVDVVIAGAEIEPDDSAFGDVGDRAKLTASAASAMPGLPATTSAPPMAGPSALVTSRVRPMSAFACCSLGALTVSGISPISAGHTTELPAP